jgi:K+-sensing histidine kinase KdpD
MKKRFCVDKMFVEKIGDSKLSLQEKICNVGDELLDLPKFNEIIQGLNNKEIKRLDLSNILNQLFYSYRCLDDLRIENKIGEILIKEQLNSKNFNDYLSLIVLSHDINNLMTFISGDAENLSFTTDKEFNSDIHKCKGDVKYYSSALVDLLNIPLISSGNEKYSFDLNSANLKSYLETKLRKSSVKLDFLVSDNINVKIYQALAISQLVKNARDSYSGMVYNDNQRIIDVHISVTEEFVAAKVIDYGKGIDPDNLNKIHGNYSSKKIKSGNGLMLVKRILNLTGGICEYTTTQKTKGTYVFNSSNPENIIKFDEEDKSGTEVSIIIPYLK